MRVEEKYTNGNYLNVLLDKNHLKYFSYNMKNSGGFDFEMERHGENWVVIKDSSTSMVPLLGSKILYKSAYPNKKTLPLLQNLKIGEDRLTIALEKMVEWEKGKLNDN